MEEHPSKKQIQKRIHESNLQSDVSSQNGDSSDSEDEKDEEINVQDQMYDRKYLEEGEEAQNYENKTQQETDEFEQALKNLDNAVNNVQPSTNINSRMRTTLSTSKFTDIATEYLQKSLKEITKKKSQNMFLKLTQILRTVINIIGDIIKGETKQIAQNPPNKKNLSKQQNVNHFHVHLYENLMTSYGSGQMMYKQYFRMVNGVFKYKKHLRVKLISKFLTGEYDLADFQLFISLIISIYPDLQSTDERILVNSLKIQETISRFFTHKLNPKQQDSLEKELQKIRIKGQKNTWVYDMDQVIELLLETNIRDIKVKQSDEYKDVYYSQDTDKRSYFNFESFQTVIMLIQGKNQLKVHQIFYSECDKLFNNENVMSLERFTQVCKSYNIISTEKQNKYLNQQDSESFINGLASLWPTQQKEIKLRLIKLNKYDMKRRKMLNEIDLFIKDRNKSHSSVLTIHFMYLLLEDESKYLLLELYINQYIPKQFFILQHKTEQILKQISMTKEDPNDVNVLQQLF